MSSCELTVAHPREVASSFVIEFFNIFRDITLLYANAGMGILIFALCIPRIALCKNSPIYKSLKISETDKKRPKLILAADAFMIIGFFLCLISTNLAPWKVLAPIFDFMQYPWRLFALAATLISIAAAIFIYILSKYTHSQGTAMIVVTTAAVLCAGMHLQTISPYHMDYRANDFYDYSENTFDISYGEWIPWASQVNIDTVKTLTDTLTLDNGKEISFGRHNGLLKFNLPKDGAEYADIPFIWYKGYTANDEEGQELETSMNDLGMLRVNTLNAKGEITVEYKYTLIKIISPIISIAAVLILTVIFILKKIRNKKKVQLELNSQINTMILENSQCQEDHNNQESSSSEMLEGSEDLQALEKIENSEIPNSEEDI